ncbi:MAG: polysaccharide biosynthesis C-terminal domain-containing protein [Flavobacteriaceae bacterium]|nr:polysaccharide biosynthesis C-terminal domain-containing protein [Flavobacteriaceae bacterium]
MKSLKLFFIDFHNRSGLNILTSTIIARILSFFASWIALQFIPSFELGLVIYAVNIISFIIPISGFGAPQGLLRYGALLNTENEKYQLFYFILKRGSLYSILLIVLIFILSPILSNKLNDVQPYLITISLSILTLFLLESLKVFFRILNQNQIFAKIEITYNVLLVVFVFLGAYFFKEKGYLAAIIIVPLITFFIFLNRIKKPLKFSNAFQKPSFSFWKYSFFTGLSNVTSQLLIVLDIILIGNILLNPEMVTIYKYISIIPFSILFLPRAILTTDFVSLTKNYSDKIYINKYIKNYILLFAIISIALLIITFLFTNLILGFFGEEFVIFKQSFRVLMIGISSILILRGLFGNLLSVIGKATINYWISLFAIIVNLISNYILIPKYGILGATITSSIIMWLTSILSVALFYFYYKNIK